MADAVDDVTDLIESDKHLVLSLYCATNENLIPEIYYVRLWELDTHARVLKSGII